MKFQRIAVIAAVIGCASCANMYIDPIETMRNQNAQNISQLSVGMSKQDIYQIMGTETAGGLLGPIMHTRIPNPYRNETLDGVDGKSYEILFYYTRVNSHDDVVTDDELTPVVLQNGRVVGIGYAFLGQRVPKYGTLR